MNVPINSDGSQRTGFSFHWPWCFMWVKQLFCKHDGTPSVHHWTYNKEEHEEVFCHKCWKILVSYKLYDHIRSYLTDKGKQ